MFVTNIFTVKFVVNIIPGRKGGVTGVYVPTNNSVKVVFADLAVQRR